MIIMLGVRDWPLPKEAVSSNSLTAATTALELNAIVFWLPSDSRSLTRSEHWRLAVKIERLLLGAKSAPLVLRATR